MNECSAHQTWTTDTWAGLGKRIPFSTPNAKEMDPSFRMDAFTHPERCLGLRGGKVAPLLFGIPGPGSKCDIFRMESVFKTTTQATLKRSGGERGSGEMDLILIPPKSRASKQDTRHRNLWHSVSLIIYEADWTSISGYGRVSASAGQALYVGGIRR